LSFRAYRAWFLSGLFKLFSNRRKFAKFVCLEEIVRKTAKSIISKAKSKVKYMVGTMIEIPRAALTADKVAVKAEFFLFLEQMI